jgi:hypothetical protein
MACAAVCGDRCCRNGVTSSPSIATAADVSLELVVFVGGGVLIVVVALVLLYLYVQRSR